MAENLNSEIKTAIENILANYTTLTPRELSIQIETAYEKALLAEFFEERAQRRENLHKRIIAQHGKQVDEQQTSDEKIRVSDTDSAAAGIANETINLTPEIKVVPHPDGPPPMPRDLENETHIPAAKPVAPPAEKLVEQETEEAPEEVPEPVAEKNHSGPTNIAERAQVENKKKSLHAQLAATSLKFGLNDRLAYVKHLFEGNAEDFNRVVSQINTLESWDEASDFIENMIKPDYNWGEKAEFEERFVNQIRTRFE